MSSARKHVGNAKLAVVGCIAGGFILGGALERVIGPAALLFVAGGVVLGVVVAVRGVARARAENQQAQDDRWGALGLVGEPYGSTGGRRYRGMFANRGVDMYHVGYELFLSVAAVTRSCAAITGPKRAIGERLDLPPMHELTPPPGLPPEVVPSAENRHAMASFLAQPEVVPILIQLFDDARMPSMRRIWSAPGGVFLRDQSAALQAPEDARRMLEQLITLAAAAERAGL